MPYQVSPRCAAASADLRRGGAVGARSSGARTALSRHHRSPARGGVCRGPAGVRAQTALGGGASAIEPSDASRRHAAEIEREAHQVAQRPAEITVSPIASRRSNAARPDAGEAAAAEAAPEIDILHQGQWRKAADIVVERA